MHRFAQRIILLALAVVLSNLAFFLLLPTAPNNGSYLATINDKYARLATTPSPKIVFIGASDLAFGLDSARIEEEFEMPVVNMGLHAGLGIRLTMESIDSYIEPGDIIIISARLEEMPNNLFYGQDDGTGVHLWLLKFRPSMIKVFNHPYYWRLMLSEYPNFIKTMRQIALITRFRQFYLLTPTTTEIPYRRDGFNKYGDLIAHLELPPRPWPTSAPEVRQANFAAINPVTAIAPTAESTIYFNNFHAFVQERDARLYAIPPPRPSSQALHAVTQQRTSSITIPVIGLQADYEYPDDHFYDAPAHLNKIGRALRTEQIIRDLSRALHQ